MPTSHVSESIKEENANKALLTLCINIAYSIVVNNAFLLVYKVTNVTDLLLYLNSEHPCSALIPCTFIK